MFDYEENLEMAFEERRETLERQACDAIANGDMEAYDILNEQLLDLNLTELGYPDIVDEVYWADCPERAYWKYTPSSETEEIVPESDSAPVPDGNSEIIPENTEEIIPEDSEEIVPVDYIDPYPIIDIDTVPDEGYEYIPECEYDTEYQLMPYEEGTFWEDLEQFDPKESEDIYNAEEAMDHWEFQGDTNRCAQFSQLFVVEEFLDVDIDPDEFCRYSEEHGWFSEEGGTTIENMNKMLDEFGIPNELSYGNGFEDLTDCLENGGRVIVAVDADEYWAGEGWEYDDSFDPNGANHAIEVVGFDPETNSVIVNDSGTPGGCGEKIPLNTFLDAWEDSGFTMIECYDPDSIPA